MGFDANALLKTRKTKSDMHRYIYETLYNNALNKIKVANEYSKTKLILDIPPITLGLPLYNIEHVIAYISRKLTNGNFQVMRVAKNAIYVSWEHIVHKTTSKAYKSLT